jgi:D-alanyl-D-alanine carboxypeptidase
MAARSAGLVERSPRPLLRPAESPPEEVLVAMADGIQDALAEAVAADAATSVTETVAMSLTEAAVPATAAAPAGVMAASLAGALLRPAPRPVVAEGSGPDTDTEDEDALTVVTRLSTSGGRLWGINVGRFSTRYEAEKVLLRTALVEMSTLNEALRKVVRSPRGWEANFVGMSQEQADLACRRLEAQNVSCSPVGPG